MLRERHYRTKPNRRMQTKPDCGRLSTLGTSPKQPLPISDISCGQLFSEGIYNSRPISHHYPMPGLWGCAGSHPGHPRSTPGHSLGRDIAADGDGTRSTNRERYHMLAFRRENFSLAD